LLSAACLLSAALAAAARADDLTLEQLAEAPNKHTGKPLSFDKVKLSGKLIKHTGLWCLKLTGPEGTTFSAAVSFSPDKLGTFFVSEDIADRLRDDLKEDDEYTVKFTCQVAKKKLSGSEAWLAEVSDIGFYQDGKIVKVINAKTPPSGKPPTLERLNEAPKKYDGKMLALDKVKLGGKMIKHTGLPCLKVTAPDGTSVSAAVNFAGGITFVVSDKLADKLKTKLKEDDEYEVKLTFKVSKKKLSGSDAWLAEVSEIGFYKDGVIKDTVK
jgi:hypothetical protein